MTKKLESFYDIASTIESIFGKVFAARPYVAIIDAQGNVMYTESQLAPHLTYIQNFIKANFNLLNVGDHSIPLGGVNLAFFKVSPKAVIAMFTQKGFTGQLLAFRPRMHEWSQKIDELIGEGATPVTPYCAPAEGEPEVLGSASSDPTGETVQNFKKVPVITKQLTGKEKFPLEVATILQFCDGKNSIEEICEKADLSKVKVNEVLTEYQKKKWLELKKVLV
ncbi:MAG: hypothetical protein LUQ65_14200 [Candidatus Helarchaeota archaeon]|nr:hypothetical protein [Candidatus Helarchaeota archaeon]